MSAPFDDGKVYPGHEYSLSQLLYGAKRKLQETTSGGRCVSPQQSHVEVLMRFPPRVATTAKQPEVTQDKIKPPALAR